MSHFGAKLKELLERKQLKAADLARTTKISDALLSKWINGQQTFVSANDLALLCLHISQAPKERAELVKAHLLDELGQAPGSELITVTIRGQASYNEPAPAFHDALPLQLRRDLELLGRESITDSDVRSVVRGLANMISGSAKPNSASMAMALNETSAALTAGATAGGRPLPPRKAPPHKQRRPGDSEKQ